MLSGLNLIVFPVPVVAVLLMGLGVIGALLQLRDDRRLWVVPALVASLCGLSMLFSGPAVEAPPHGSPLQDFGGEANFQSQWNAHRELWGDPVGDCGVRAGIFTCPTKFGRMEFHPEEPKPYYRIANGNVGIDMATARHIALDAPAVLPPIMVSFLAAEANRGVDTLWWYGNPYASPVVEDGRSCMYFEKALFCFPTDATNAGDPSLVTREPAGAMLWSIEARGVDPVHPDPWTPSRRLELLGGLLALLIAALPLLLPGVFPRRYAYGDI